MGGLENAVAGHVVDVGPRSDADASHLGGQGVGQVVAVEIHGGDHLELGRPGEHLLEGDVGDGILHQDLVAGVAVAVVPAHGHVGELLAHQLVAPAAERPLGELHDVALVHPVDPLAVPPHGVVQRGPLEALRAGLGHRLDADPGVLGDIPAQGVVEQIAQLGCLRGECLHLKPGVDVLGVLPEDHHVHQLRVLHRGGHVGEPAHWAQAHVQVHDLADRHVEAAESAPHRGGQRAFDADEVLGELLDGVLGQPVAGLVEGLLPG